jgi:branched-chain amino acid transport system permease protein
MSAFVAGIGGGLYGHYIVTFGAEDFYFAMTFTVVLMLVLGGMTSVSGAVVGVVFVTVVQEVLRKIETGPLNNGLPGFSKLCLAILLVLVLILRPRGLTNGHEIPWPGDRRRVGGKFRRKRDGGDPGISGGGRKTVDAPAQASSFPNGPNPPVTEP